MLLCEWLLAAALLTGDPPLEFADPAGVREHFPTLRLPLIRLALEWEILDPRETRFVLTKPEEFEADVAMLRRRYHELVAAPPLDDAQRFPERSVVNELLVFNRAYRKFLEERQPIDSIHADELRQVQREVDQLYQIWDAVRDARCEYYYVTVRRQALKRLRELLNEEDYYQGRLPPHVPLWRFQDIRD
jgi:hypothetical protein